MVKAVKFANAFSNLWYSGAKQYPEIASSSVAYSTIGNLPSANGTATAGYVSFWYNARNNLPMANWFYTLGGTNVSFGPYYGGIIGACDINKTPALQIYFKYVPNTGTGKADTYVYLRLNSMTSKTQFFEAHHPVALPMDNNWHWITISWNMGNPGGGLNNQPGKMATLSEATQATEGKRAQNVFWPKMIPSIVQAQSRVDGATPRNMATELTVGYWAPPVSANRGTNYSVGDLLAINDPTYGIEIARWEVTNTLSYPTPSPIDTSDFNGYNGLRLDHKGKYSNYPVAGQDPYFASRYALSSLTGAGYGAEIDAYFGSTATPFTIDYRYVDKWWLGFYPEVNGPFVGDLAQVYVYLSDYFVDLFQDTISGAAPPNSPGPLQTIGHRFAGPSTSSPSGVQGYDNVDEAGIDYMHDDPAIYLHGDSKTFFRNGPKFDDKSSFIPAGSMALTIGGVVVSSTLKQNTSTLSGLVSWTSSPLTDSADDPFSFWPSNGGP